MECSYYYSYGDVFKLPVLTVVFNKQRWDAVGSSTASRYPESYTARANARDGFGPLSALGRALKVATQEKRQALVNVIGS